MKQIVVLGGGYGGALTAKKLGNLLKKQPDAKITVIDRNPYQTLLTELHEVAAGRVEESSIKVDLHKVFAGFKNVEVVQDEITRVDLEANQLLGEDQTYRYDYLIMGTGSKPTFYNIKGAEENTFSLWSFEDAVNLKEQILHSFRQAVKERNPQKRKELLSFVIVGAGFTGVEMVGELAEYVQVLCKDHHIDRSEVHLYIVDMMDKILPILPDPLIRKAEKRLQKLGVTIITKAAITEVTKNSVVLPQREIASRTVVWTAGVENADVPGMDIEKNPRNRFSTNDKLQIPEYPNVYVVGDNIHYIPEGAAYPVPQMVENAELAAPLIAHNIAAALSNKPLKSYSPTFHGTMVSIGSRYGVANVGMPGKMFKLSGFFAMAVKHLINLVYLFQLSGFNKTYSYLLHEIFHVRNRRSLVGGHLSKRSPNFWLFPLRLFVGYKWFMQGWDKVPQILDDPHDIFLIPAPSVDGTAAVSGVDGVASASDVAHGADWGIALPVWGWLESIVNWSMNLFFYTSDGGYTILATIFQIGMVGAEVVFGLLLILGLFTAPSAVITVIMGMMIWVSGMAPTEMIWYLTGGIALIGGSGSTLGLDYYMYPWLKEKWRKVPLVRRFYLYAD